MTLSRDAARSVRPLVSIVTPAYCEAENLPRLHEEIALALAGEQLDWELIIVDDGSVDATWERVVALRQVDDRVHGVRLSRNFGHQYALLAGLVHARGDAVISMDADLQHDETVLRRMYETLSARPEIDLVVGSRFVDGASVGALSPRRARLSRIGNALSSAVLRAEVSDPLSGFFVLRREVLDEVAHALSGQGFKILLDILSSTGRRLAVIELPLEFRERHSGQSKLDLLVALEFAMLLADKTLGRIVPIRFVLFVLVGLFGVVVHLAFLAAALKSGGLPFYWAQALATWSAMTVNFYLNNKLTYRDRQLRGSAFAKGLLSFWLACAIGAIINLRIAELLYEQGALWPIAGTLGAVVGSVWNYGITSTFTWRAAPRPAHA